MTDTFTHDVFISHSSKDKDVVRPLVERLRADGVRVWFDEWELKPGDSIPEKIEEGLECSRVLVLCMSANAFGSDWSQLEAGTFRFRDPLNKERRFIPLRLDDSPIKGSLAQVLHIDWPKDHEQEYAKLYEVCRQFIDVVVEEIPEVTAERVIQLGSEGWTFSNAFSPDRKLVVTGSTDNTVRLWDMETAHCLNILHGHTEPVWAVEWSPDQKRILTGSKDTTLRLWDVETGACLSVLNGHSQAVRKIAWCSDLRRVLSGSSDTTLRLWDVETGQCLQVLEGHSAQVWDVTWSTDKRRALTAGGLEDQTVRLWDVETGRCMRILEGHSSGVLCVAWSPNGKYALSGSLDNTIRLWDIEAGTCLRVLKGHTRHVWSVAWSSDNCYVVSGSEDNTIRVWEIATGSCLLVLKGHRSTVKSIAWSVDDRCVLSGDYHDIRIWDLSRLVGNGRVPKPRAHNIPPTLNQVKYTNAKVLLVGESGVGKTGLSKRLALNNWQPSDSTVGAWATQWKLPVASGDGIEREIWLWDFGGQADQRLIHQLYLDETALAVLVFDGQKEDLFETLGQWDRDLARASRKPFTKLLATGRMDAGGLRVSRSQVEAFAKEHGYSRFLETSAKSNLGCEELKQAILSGIRWEEIPWRSSPLLFKQIKEEIVRLKDEGRVLIRFNELRETLQLRLSGEVTRFNDEELKAVVSLLAGPAVVWELKFGSWVLLQPERINSYAQAVIHTLRDDPLNRGCISEEMVLLGALNFQTVARLPKDEERIVLLAMHQMLVERAICLRETTDEGNLLVFPIYYRRERPELLGHPDVQVSYRFNGFLDDIYTTLVVRLHHTKAISSDQLWRYAADFKTHDGKKLGIKLRRLGEGTGELEVYFDSAISVRNKIVFSKFIHEHIMQKGQDVVRLRHYVCPYCRESVGHRDAAMKRLSEGRKDILCVYCEKRIPLLDELEKLFTSDLTKQLVREMEERSSNVLEQESKERLLVGEIISTVDLAGQVCREFSASDHGIDMEIEFKTDSGEVTGKKVYLQLKSGDSYLKKRKRDGADIFSIPTKRHIDYWMAQIYPVMLIIRTSEGDIRCMEIRDWLKRKCNNGKKTVKQIEFDGERFDVMSVRRWRDKALCDPLLHYSRDSLLDVLDSYPDEVTRCMAARRLAAWPEIDIRDRLLFHAETDTSSKFRVSCYEALCDGWWREREIRRWIRARIKVEPEEQIRELLTLAVQNSRKHLSGIWESRLSEQQNEAKEPEAVAGYPAIRVLRFRLRDIGPFLDTGEVELQPDINVFLGDNAAGKTTLMRCLALATIGIAAANEVVDNPEAYLRKGARRGSIEVLFELLPDPDALPGESGYFAVGLEIESGSSRFSPTQTLTLHSPNPAFGLTNSAEYLSTIRSKRASQFGFISAYGAVRTFSESRYSIQTELKKTENEWVLSLFNPEARLVNPDVFSKLIRGDTSNIEEGPLGGLSDNLIESLRTSLKHLFPEVTKFFGEGDNDLQLNGTPFRFGEMSDGYRSLFALMGHLLRCSLRTRNWKDNPTEIDGIALIDEMDLHLHPAWQIHVVQDFRKAFPNLQLIASTHSPLVVAALKRENVLIMRREANGSIAVERPDLDPQGLGVAGILTSIFDLSSTIDQPTLDKITRRLLLYSKREHWNKEDELEYLELTEHLATLGFNREFADPYFEIFATTMAKRHQAILSKLKPAEKQELDEYADRLLANLKEGDGR